VSTDSQKKEDEVLNFFKDNIKKMMMEKFVRKKDDNE